MADSLLAVLWYEDKIVSFVLDGQDIIRHEFPICPTCRGVIDEDLDAPAHIAACSGVSNTLT